MSLSEVFELRVSNPTGVFKNTMPGFALQTEPFKAIEGLVSS
jgi:hypothetical protein